MHCTHSTPRKKQMYQFKDSIRMMSSQSNPMISHLIPIVATWHLVCREISKYKPENVSKNITDLIHSTIFLLHYTNEYDLLYATQISIGFYVYDTIHMLKHEPLNRTAKYILHHVLAIYMLNMTTSVPKDAANFTWIQHFRDVEHRALRKQAHHERVQRPSVPASGVSSG